MEQARLLLFYAAVVLKFASRRVVGCQVRSQPCSARIPHVRPGSRPAVRLREISVLPSLPGISNPELKWKLDIRGHFSAESPKAIRPLFSRSVCEYL